MSDDMYITGGDSALFCRRELGIGGYGVVHELYDIPAGKAFARKLIPISRVNAEVYENEIQAITKLCGSGTHPHIVTVLKTGRLYPYPFLFIDMELCDLNLKEYIHCTKDRPSVPIYFVKNRPPPLKALQIWNVMSHIAKGVQFLHSKGMVHRDLKPANILYSRKDMVWKLADFGLSTEATSRSFRVTTSPKGTEGYYAPEFLVDNPPQYNNKADIWSLGCILYEFAVGKQAFRNDIATIQCKLKDIIPNVYLDEYFGDECKVTITNCVNEMLKFDPNLRPAAAKMVEIFSANLDRIGGWSGDSVQVCQEFQISPQSAQFSTPLPSSPQITPTTARSTPGDLFASFSQDSPEIIPADSVLSAQGSTPSTPEEPLPFSQTAPEISSSIPTETNATIPIVEAEIQNEPYNFWLWHALCTLYAAEDDLDGAIRACESGAQSSITNPSPIMELMNLYAAKGNYGAAVEKGRELLKIQSVDLRRALTGTKSPLIASIVHNFEAKQSSLELISKELLHPDTSFHIKVHLKNWVCCNPVFKVKNIDIRASLLFAAWSGDRNTLETLQIHDVEPGDRCYFDTWNPLTLAVWAAHLEIVNAITIYSITNHSTREAIQLAMSEALRLATDNRDVKMIKTLLDTGPSIYWKDKHNITLMYRAAEVAKSRRLSIDRSALGLGVITE